MVLKKKLKLFIKYYIKLLIASANSYKSRKYKNCSRKRGAEHKQGRCNKLWTERARFKLTPFCIVSANVVQKGLMFLHRVNNIEHNIKQNIYTGMERTFLIPP